MSDSFPIFDAVVRQYRSWRFRLRYRAGRWKRAWSYARDRMSADDAQKLLIDCEYDAGWFGLLTLTVEDTLEQAFDEYADHPDLRRLLTDGCARVSKKWEGHGDELYYARRWAIELAADYARSEGIVLIPCMPDDESGNALGEPASEGSAP